MRLIIALRSFNEPGGLQTFILTLVEALLPLGHDVAIFSPNLGRLAQYGRERHLTIVDRLADLPVDVDATIASDRVLALDLAVAFPTARRAFLMHCDGEFWLPPEQPGIVAMTLAPNDRLATMARGCVGAGQVVRIRQPVDLVRFSRRGPANSPPVRVLLLSNYAAHPNQRSELLRSAWSQRDLQWRQLGGDNAVIETESEIAMSDIVVGYGRAILEGMSCARPAFVHEHSGSDGWVTPDNYERLEADGFTGASGLRSATLADLQRDFDLYDPFLGEAGRDLIRAHHDSRRIAADIVAHIGSLDPVPLALDRKAIQALRNLSVLYFRSAQRSEQYRIALMDMGLRLRAAEAREALLAAVVTNEREEVQRLQMELEQVIRAFRVP